MAEHISPKDPAVLVVSWDGYADVWAPFFHCFFKYWPDCPYPVFLGSNSKQYPDNRVLPILTGADVDYSSNILAMLSQVNQEWVILWMEDFILSVPVDTLRIRKIVGLAQREGAAYVNLVRLPLEIAPLFSKNDLQGEIGEVLPGAPYRIALGAALWNKRALMKLLRPGETAWDIERQGSLRSRDLYDKFYCVSKQRIKDPPLRVVNTIEAGHWTRAAISFFRREGLQEHLGTRPVETYQSHVCLKWYCYIRYLSIKLLYTLGGGKAMRFVAKLISKRTLVVQN